MGRKYTSPAQDAIRAALRMNPDGLTVSALAVEAGMSIQSALNAVQKMQDLCIDRWYPHQQARMWCAVYVLKPEDAPKPEVKVMDYLRKTGQATSIAA